MQIRSFGTDFSSIGSTKMSIYAIYSEVVLRKRVEKSTMGKSGLSWGQLA